MEWMLQVVDEFDDALSTVGLYTLGLRVDLKLLLAGSIGIGALFVTG
jgi:hypothetical protein